MNDSNPYLHNDTSGLDHNSSESDSTTHITAEQPRDHVELVRKAAGFKAGFGQPVFPVHFLDDNGVCSCGGPEVNPKCRPAKHPIYDKRLGMKKGFKSATTDRSKVEAWWDAYPGANIGVPTGKASGYWVLDVDDRQALEKLQKEHGKLPETLGVRTPRGGLHLHFQHVEGIGIKTGELPEGFDVRGDGGYVLARPSAGYELEVNAPVDKAPEWLVDLILEREEKEKPQESRRRDGSQKKARKPRASTLPEGSTIPEGSRNQTLFFWALDRKDEGRSREEVLGLVLTENDARSEVPLERGEVEGLVKSAMRYPLRCGNPSPELLEACDRLDEDWWRRKWKGRGGGGHTDRDVKAAVIELARRYGRLRPDGSVEVSASVRSLALASAVSYVTVSGSATKRLAKSGQIVKLDNGRTSTQAATWRLLPPPAEPFNTQQEGGSSTTLPPMPCVKGLRPIGKRVWDLETPAFRRSGHVGKGAGGVLYYIEASPFTVLEHSDIADHLDISVSELLRRGYLKRLLDNGLLVEVREGAYRLPDAYAEKIEEVRRAPYATTRKQKVWRKERTHPERRAYRVCEVREVGSYASEAERDERQHLQNQQDSEKWRRLAQTPPPESDPDVISLLNRWDEEREAA